MEIVLSGGDFGGTICEWSKHGVLEDGRESMNIETLVYAKVDETMAIFTGYID